MTNSLTCNLRNLSTLVNSFKRIIEWIEAADITSGYVFLSIWHGGRNLRSRPLNSIGFFTVVKKWSKEIGINLSPHDLRRTFARMALNNDASIHSISQCLGHSSVKTTEIYIGSFLDFKNPVGDYLPNPDDGKNGDGEFV